MSLIHRLKEWVRMRRLKHRHRFASFEELEALALTGRLDPGDFRVLCGGQR